MPLPKSLDFRTLEYTLNQNRANGIPMTLWDAIKHSDPNWSKDHTLDDYYREYGVDMYYDTMRSMYSSNSYPSITPALFTEALNTILIDFFVSPVNRYRSICKNSFTSDGGTYLMPYIDENKPYKKTAGPDQEIEPTADFPLEELVIKVKRNNYRKFGRILRGSYEFFQDCRLDLLTKFLPGFIAYLESELFEWAVSIMINGDQSVDFKNNKLPSASAFVGVEEIGKISEDDFFIPCARMARAGFPPDVIIASENTLKKIRKFPAYDERRVGEALVQLTPESDDSRMPKTLFLSDELDDSQIILMNSQFGLGELIRQPLLIERQKDITKQTHDFTISMRLGMSLLFQKAAVILRTDKAYASNPMPAYFYNKKSA